MTEQGSYLQDADKSFSDVMAMLGKQSREYLERNMELQTKLTEKFIAKSTTLMSDRNGDINASVSTSPAFEKLSEHLQQLADELVGASSRNDSLKARNKITLTEKVMKNDPSLSEDESSTLEEILSVLKDSSDFQQREQFSLTKTMAGSLVDNLPSVTGLLASIGLNNPALLFAGQVVQDMWTAKKQSQQEAKDQAADLQVELRKALVENERMTINAIEVAKAASDAAVNQVPVKDTDALNEPKAASDAAVNQVPVKDTDALATDIQKTIIDSIGELVTPDDLSESILIAEDKLIEFFKDNDITTSMSNMDIKLTESFYDQLVDAVYPVPEHIMETNNKLKKLQEIISGDKLSSIEASREGNRQQEKMIDAIENISDDRNSVAKKEDGKGGLIGSVLGAIGLDNPKVLLGISTTLTSGLAVLLNGIGAFGPLMAKIGSGFLGIGKKLLGPVALIFAAIDFSIGAFKGWGNAAEKFGKNIEDVTVFDKIASAIGGGIGSLLGFVDDILGLFGVDIDIGGMADKFISNGLRKVFEWYDNFWGAIFDGLESVGSTIKSLIGTGVSEIHGIYSKMTDTILGIFQGVYDKIDEWTGFSLPSIDFKEIQRNLMDSLFGLLKGIPGMSKILKKFGVIGDKEESGIRSITKEKPENTIDRLEESGAIDRDFIGNSDINDWNAISNLSPEEIQQVLDINDWSQKDKDRLLDILDEKSGRSILEPYPIDMTTGIEAKERRDRDIVNDSIESAKTKTQPTIISAPTTNTKNISNQSNSVVSHSVSPRQQDMVLATANLQFAQ